VEVIYTGLHQTPEQIVETAIQEDADAVGISILSGAHMTLVPRILDGLKENGADDVVVVVGGTIPREDTEELKGLVLRVGIANHNCGPEWSSPRVGRLARSAGSPGEQGNAFRLAPLEVRR
jgi:methylmalonyl-CoA mutase cobalamin-binding domain/chain